MPRRRHGRYSAEINALRAGRPPRHPLDRPVGKTSDCLVEHCPHPPMDDAPVQLCGKHIREVWQYAQGVIADQLLVAAARLIE